MTYPFPFLLALCLLSWYSGPVHAGARAPTPNATTLPPVPPLAGAVQVWMKEITLYTTHEWFLHTPEVYFQCEGEPRKFLTGVVKAHQNYSFSLHESFQPVTELEVPQCKRCGLFEKDMLTEDDVFDRFELCPLDFSEPPEGQLRWEAPGQMNITFFCTDCNTRNSFAGGEILTTTARSPSGFLVIFLIALGAGLSLSALVICLVTLVREGKIPWLGRGHTEDAKFMEMFGDDEEDDFLAGNDDLDFDDVEMVRQGQGHPPTSSKDD